MKCYSNSAKAWTVPGVKTQRGPFGVEGEGNSRWGLESGFCLGWMEAEGICHFIGVYGPERKRQ